MCSVFNVSISFGINGIPFKALSYIDLQWMKLVQFLAHNFKTV